MFQQKTIGVTLTFLQAESAANKIPQIDHELFKIIGEEPVTLLTSLLLTKATTEQVWEKVTTVYMKENMQSKINLRYKIHSVFLQVTYEL